MFQNCYTLSIMEGSSSGMEYSKESLREAVRSILNEELSVSQAVEKYGCIPRRTLQHHVKYEQFIYSNFFFSHFLHCNRNYHYSLM